MCEKKFSNTVNLRAHVVTNHIRSSSDVFACNAEGCNKKFSRDKYLKQHVEHVHEKLHEYRCPAEGCGKVFPWKVTEYSLLYKQYYFILNFYDV